MGQNLGNHLCLDLHALGGQLRQWRRNIGIHRGNRRVEPAPEGLQQRINELEGELRQRSRQEEELQQRINELEGQLGQRSRREEEIQQLINEREGRLRQRGSQMTTMDWLINRNDIQINHSHELGRGAWGVVYRGTFHYCEVAVKQMHEEIIGSNRGVFEREVNMASRCRHPCLLLFIGATADERPLLVTELLECSLRNKLFTTGRPLPVHNERVISLDVATALHYLHERKPEPILHNDVSSSNVLLWRSGNQWRAKLSDYGTANFVHRSNINYAGAFVYSAPEYVRTENRVSCKTWRQRVGIGDRALDIQADDLREVLLRPLSELASFVFLRLDDNERVVEVKADVYSYGVLLCEMSIREEPNREQLEMQIQRIEIHHPHPKIRPLVRRCVDQDPRNRPSMDEIIEELTNSP